MGGKGYGRIVKGGWIGGRREIIEMVCILLFCDNTEDGWRLVKLMAMPMIWINWIGRGIFLCIILCSIKEEEERGGIETDDVLEVGKERLVYLGCG
ncbi:LytS/YhcK type 5TM receptor domain-containing protein, partial [Staphylococcus saprophyticus]|uniref:LytS/YhcK type 5TM receptor domain-containing protein n=1 Tax=Staphylococcus saprophyticus TaxID=29385 RepID=UPI0028CB9380